MDIFTVFCQKLLKICDIYHKKWAAKNKIADEKLYNSASPLFVIPPVDFFRKFHPKGVLII